MKAGNYKDKGGSVGGGGNAAPLHAPAHRHHPHILYTQGAFFFYSSLLGADSVAWSAAGSLSLPRPCCVGHQSPPSIPYPSCTVVNTVDRT